MEIHGKRDDPYRIFFPLGIVLGIIGVSIWPLYYFGLVESYSGRAHAFVQIDGFLYAFIAGFLLTAIPRFTGTEAPSLRTQYVSAALLIACAVSFELWAFAIGTALFVLMHTMVMTLAIRRFLRRAQDPPETFPLVGMGMFAGAAGAVVEFAIAWNLLAPKWDLLGKRLESEGMVLLLVLGVGGFLGPRLMGFAALPKFERAEKLPRSNSLFYKVAGLAVLVSLFGEYGFGVAPLVFLRAGAVTAVIAVAVQPWRLPVTRTTLAWCVWTAEWFVAVSVWFVALAPKYRIDFLHILFIGGFTLLIFAIGTRVVLSHGGHSLALEKRSWPLRIGLTTGLIAMLARAGAPFAGFTYFAHLAYAGVLWIGGMLLWGIYVLRWLRTNKETHSV